jgi:hypothetical protein
MKRFSLAAALIVVFAVPAATSARSTLPQPIYFWGNVAAMISGPGGASDTVEAIRPSAIVLFADGSWDIDHLHWAGWGSSVAHARGISSASNGIPNQAQGRRIKHAARITVSHPGRFRGREVYRCYQLTVRRAAITQRACLGGASGYHYFTSR